MLFVLRVNSTRMPTPPFATGIPAPGASKRGSPVCWHGVCLRKRTGVVYLKGKILSIRKNSVIHRGKSWEYSQLPPRSTR